MRSTSFLSPDHHVQHVVHAILLDVGFVAAAITGATLEKGIGDVHGLLCAIGGSFAKREPRPSVCGQGRGLGNPHREGINLERRLHSTCVNCCFLDNAALFWTNSATSGAAICALMSARLSVE